MMTTPPPADAALLRAIAALMSDGPTVPSFDAATASTRLRALADVLEMFTDDDAKLLLCLPVDSGKAEWAGQRLDQIALKIRRMLGTTHLP
jgi:hypothetical protein